ncbi:MAG: ribosome maturation factor RimP [Eubacteriales bacterium]|nr:ribosome maturation factor RimP [Eubacteriales bacterium]
MAKVDVIGRVQELLAEFISGKDLEIYNVEYRKEGPEWKLRVYLDKPEDSETEFVNIEECEEVNRYLSDKLDEIELIDRKYTIEVSSPGMDRELIHDKDFQRFAGRVVEVRLYEPLNGQKNFEAVLLGRTEEDVIQLDVDGERMEIPHKKISKINLAVIF